MEKTVGKTPLLPFPDLDPGTLFRHAYVKDESRNPSGSIKDRRNLHIVNEAVRLGVDKLVLITSGNSGYSLATLAKGTPLLVVCIVDKNIDAATKDLLRKVAYQVIEVNLQHKILRPEEVISFAREREDEVIWEVTNGYEQAYASLVAELRPLKPDYIVTPVGSGENFVGFVNGVDFYRLPTKVIGIGVQNQSHSFADKLYTPWTPYSKALTIMQKRGHVVYRLSEDEIRSAYDRMKGRLQCEPSSAVVFAAPDKHNFRPEDVIVFINSGQSPAIPAALA